MTGVGLMGGGGATAGADEGASGMVMDSPSIPKGVGLGMNMGDGDLLLIILL